MIRRFLLLMALFAAQFARADAGDLVKFSVLENDVAYLRVGNVGKNLLGEIQSQDATTNKISGIILDLRFAGGEMSESVNGVADLLAQKKLPVAVLIDAETHGAALELAKSLRGSKAGLIFGDSKDLKPDILISANAADEKNFLENPYGTVSTNAIPLASTKTTNDFLPYVDHTTEADLVRARIKDGEEDENLAKQRAVEPQKPFIRDPVLARGVDFIKGLAVLRLSHS
jgi:hypothetical protein